jgi:hypothetical protein
VLHAALVVEIDTRALEVLIDCVGEIQIASLFHVPEKEEKETSETREEASSLF